mmetsp:Transcript_2281/g.5416  ORF Transcript_2281/g.5416 Transcript_2281/m.5416 type:complete len:91 (+) Transcript_2281:254-526(+)
MFHNQIYQIVERTKVEKQERRGGFGRLLIKEQLKVKKQEWVDWKVDERITKSPRPFSQNCGKIEKLNNILRENRRLSSPPQTFGFRRWCL